MSLKCDFISHIFFLANIHLISYCILKSYYIVSHSFNYMFKLESSTLKILILVKLRSKQLGSIFTLAFYKLVSLNISDNFLKHLFSWCVCWFLSRVWLFATPWTVAHQAPLSVEFSRQEYWSGLPFPSSRWSSQPRDGTQLSCIAGRLFTIWHPVFL